MRKYFIVLTCVLFVQSIAIAKDASKQQITNHDINIFADFQEYSGAWNRTSGPIVRDYLDPKVSAEKWVESMNVSLPILREIYMKMNSSLLLFQSDKVRQLYKPLVASYKLKLDSLTALHIAIYNGDAESAAKAQQSLHEAGQEGQRLATEFMNGLRKYIAPEELDRIMKERLKNATEAMKPNTNSQ